MNDSGKQNESISILSYETPSPAASSRITLQQHLFSFLLEGQKTVHYAGLQETITPQQFLLMPAGNCLMSEKLVAAGGRYRSVLLFFDQAILAEFLQGRQPAPRPSRVRKELPFLRFEKDPFLVNFAESLRLMLLSGHPASPEMRLVKLRELLLYLNAAYPGQIDLLRAPEADTDMDKLIRQAVTANIDNAITVEELAFLCNTSLSSFKRRFAQLFGTSPGKWLLARRMDRAAGLLRQRGHTASEIYFELGYENLSSFIQAFKQVHGVTPKQYQLTGMNL